ncbi:2-keto-4-pentenoate hydratase [Malaciobacter molluscorum LMG 25693]|uniref:2-keto-4-pentenoate hydratase n=1 Tax=Malaciobacter molluscorum LMG 25693 TaxID=870501 RepID=A0A2G1DHT9_9BACT|nr:fumarylacetoacetate hydrolase family protein [Malaciobacter molluscorum]AXX93011.1 fumarylacetoacetate hydrolase family protein [Malaciobacter molluscorum LMG 25693]PHO18068.1 2-keto-4-pentenoate hydratase [Malaciobacter molluscorum LMG 25693]RXJ94875.1 2-keto-4-pentenoate hydratase [Malaciobacter molluscorum]
MRSIILDDDIKIVPSKVVCIGRNYVEHIKELDNDIPDEMVFFIKPNSSISQKLIFPQGEPSCHYESEISFLLENNKISAVGFGLDLTLRHVQSKLKKAGLPWERAKAFRNSAVFSKFVSFDGDVNKLSLQLFINEELKQKGGVSLMINKPENIINEANTFLDFEDADILMTGTPVGVDNFKKGDIFIGKILYDEKILLEQRFEVF